MSVSPTAGSTPRSHDSLEGSPVDHLQLASYSDPQLTALFQAMTKSQDAQVKMLGVEGLKGRVALARLKEVEVLDLSSCQLTELPPSIGLLTDLIEINLTNNHLTDLPEALTALPKLQILKLQKNNLETFPPVIGKLSHLGSLYLCDNPLREMPIAFRSHLRSIPNQAKWVN